MATKRSNNNREEERGDKRVRVTAPHETAEGIV